MTSIDPLWNSADFLSFSESLLEGSPQKSLIFLNRDFLSGFEHLHAQFFSRLLLDQIIEFIRFFSYFRNRNRYLSLFFRLVFVGVKPFDLKN